MKATARRVAASRTLVEVAGLDLDTPGGRPLIRGLSMTLTEERVALIGRNGVGKSSLLDVLAGRVAPRRGSVRLETNPMLVGQRVADSGHRQAVGVLLTSASKAGLGQRELGAELAAVGLGDILGDSQGSGFSLGELRKLYLLAAKLAEPELLLLDEPTQDLDTTGRIWLKSWLPSWQRGLVLVSHDQDLLRQFSHFFVVAESGCRYFAGTLGELEARLELEEAANQRRYVRRLNALRQRERHREQFRKRRERKKNVGRVRELGRMTPRSRLNQKRSYAQEKQGRIAKIREDRISVARAWAKAARRALGVALPLGEVVPRLPDPDGGSLITLAGVSAGFGDRRLFSEVDLSVRRDRVAVLGPNGSGKTTLLQVMLGQKRPQEGRARRQMRKIGAIAQGGTDWMTEESVLEYLTRMSDAASPEDAAKALVAHRFPLALAQRSLASLSPGERVRAGIVCLLQRTPPVELLVLDEPTWALDLVGVAALRTILEAWPGGLVVASHDQDFLEHLGMSQRLTLDGKGGCWLETVADFRTPPAGGGAVGTAW